MATLSNNFNSGTDGTTMTGGSGGNTASSGDYIDAISQAAGAIVIFAAGAAYEGALGARLATRGTSGDAVLRWTSRLSVVADHYGRVFMKYGAKPPTSARIITLFDGTNEIGHIKLTNTNKLAIYGIVSGVQTLLTTSTTTLTTNTWYRLGYHVHADTANAFIELRIYTDPTASVSGYAETLGASNTFAGPGNTVSRAYYGPLGAAANWPSSTTYLDLDGIVAGATTWVGPITTPSVQFTGAIAATSTVSGSVRAIHKVAGAISATSIVGGSLFKPGQPTTDSTYGVGTYGSAIYGGSGAPSPAGIRGAISATSTVSGGVTRISSSVSGGSGTYTPPYTPPTPPPTPEPLILGDFALAVYGTLNGDQLTG